MRALTSGSAFSLGVVYIERCLNFSEYHNFEVVANVYIGYGFVRRDNSLRNRGAENAVSLPKHFRSLLKS